MSKHFMRKLVMRKHLRIVWRLIKKVSENNHLKTLRKTLFIQNNYFPRKPMNGLVFSKLNVFLDLY